MPIHIKNVTKNSLPGGTPGDKIVRTVKFYAGCSLDHRADELGALVARGVDDPKVVNQVVTNCGMFALGVFAEVGVNSPILERRYVNGKAITWLCDIGRQMGALVRWKPNGPQPLPGALLRYNTAGTNDDHVEFMLSPIDAHGWAEHGGGGRTRNAIRLSARSYVLSNNARPLVEFWDVEKLGIEVVMPGSDINEAYPEES